MRGSEVYGRELLHTAVLVWVLVVDEMHRWPCRLRRTSIQRTSIRSGHPYVAFRSITISGAIDSAIARCYHTFEQASAISADGPIHLRTA